MGLNAIIDLLLNSAQFDSALNKSEQRIKGFAREAEKAGKIAGKIGTGLSMANVAGLDKLAQSSKFARAGIEGLTGAMLLLGAVPIPIAIGVAAAGALAAYVLNANSAQAETDELLASMNKLAKSATELAVAPLFDQIAKSAQLKLPIENQIARLNDEIERTNKIIRAQGGQENVGGFFDATRKEIALLEAELERHANAERVVWKKIQEIRASAAESGVGGKSIADKAAEQARRAQEKMTADQEREAAKRIAIAEREANAAARAAEKAAEQRAKFDADWDQALEDMADSWDENFQAKAESMSIFADQAARNMQSAFADFLFDPFANGLDGMLKGFIQVIQRMIAEAAAAQIFQSLGIGGSGGLLNSILGGVGVAGARAEGGPVSAGKSYLVGEEGPEIVRMGGNGSVIPNHRLGGGGGMAVTVNIDARNATDPAAIYQAGQLIRRQVLGDVAVLMRRGYVPGG